MDTLAVDPLSDKYLVGLKQCRKCLLHKPFTDFQKGTNGLYGLKGRCKSCVKESALVYNKTKKAIDYHRLHSQIHTQKYPKKVKARAWVHRNRDRLGFNECAICGMQDKLEYHHPNYDIIYFVIPLCTKCHAGYHHSQLQLTNELVQNYYNLCHAIASTPRPRTERIAKPKKEKPPKIPWVRPPPKEKVKKIPAYMLLNKELYEALNEMEYPYKDLRQQLTQSLFKPGENTTKTSKPEKKSIEKP